jgi:transposase InsO family protein
LDAFSRRIVGWAMETYLRSELVLEALNMALAQRRAIPRACRLVSDDATDLGWRFQRERSHIKVENRGQLRYCG